MTTLIISIVSLVFVLFWYLNYRANYWKRRNVKGPRALPLIGNLWECFFYPNTEVEMRRRRKYGSVYGTMQAMTPVITIADPDLVKQIAVRDGRVILNRKNYAPGDEFAAKMMPHLEDDEWRRVRTLIAPAFSPAKIKSMVPLVEKCVNNTLQYFDSVAQNDEYVDLRKVMISYTIDVTARCVFAMESNGYKNPDQEFLRKVRQCIDFKVWRIFSSVLLPAKIKNSFNLGIMDANLRNYITFVLKKTIDERRKMKNSKYVDFVQLLLNAELQENETENTSDRKKLTENEITIQCFIFLLLGYETTATQLNFALYELAVKPNIQNKLHEEIEKYFAETGKFEFDSLNSLPYLDAVLCESLRHYPPIVNLDRVCGEDYELGNTGITIEKGTIVNIPFYAMQHDPNLFPDPDQFKPERFLPENRDSIHPYAYIPFGIGARICLGIRFSTVMSKMILAKIVHQFEILKCEKTVETPKSISKLLKLDCKPLIVKFRKRK